MPRYKLTIEYDGSAYAGWQRQDTMPSVQQAIEEAITRYCQAECPLTAAGRTDAGVHATGQVAHVDLPTERSEFSVRQGLNFHLIDTGIAIVHAELVEDDFHARFGAQKRYYSYRILNRPAPSPLDVKRAWHLHQPLAIDAMRDAATHLIGKHDFTSFRASECQSQSPVKTLENIRIEQVAPYVTLHLSAKSFLHHQVRNIVGTLSLVGIGKWDAEQVKEALHAKDRSAAGPTAPAHGLYFTRVEY